MGAALLMVALPPVRTERGVEAVNAMVSVGPPLFCRGPRLRAALVTTVAQELVLVKVLVLVSKVTMLFARVVGSLTLPETIRFTVPPPE